METRDYPCPCCRAASRDHDGPTQTAAKENTMDAHTSKILDFPGVVHAATRGATPEQTADAMVKCRNCGKSVKVKDTECGECPTCTDEWAAECEEEYDEDSGEHWLDYA